MDEQYSLESPSYSLIGKIMGGIILFLLGIIVLPALLPAQRPVGHSSCQANLKQIGNSLKMYLADWEETYPTNRPYLKNGKLGPVSSYVKLSALGIDKTTQKPYKFQYGVNWVEGLYNYMEPAVGQDDASSVWKCPAIAESAGKPTSDSAATTYVFNRNLIGLSENSAVLESSQMVVREMSYLVDAELRPTNKSTGKPDEAPKSPFLSVSKPHGVGSNILFADGHVQLMDVKYQSHGCEFHSGAWFNAGDPKRDSKQVIQVTPLSDLADELEGNGSAPNIN